MSLAELNALSANEALQKLLDCCHCERWAQLMLRQRPYASSYILQMSAEHIWRSLTDTEWLEAFAAHPKIGDLSSLHKKFSSTRSLAAKEQQGADGADEKTLGELALLNRKYEEKFGFTFIVFATGKTADQMLEILRSRFNNAREQELNIAAEEQFKIMRLRLEKL